MSTPHPSPAPIPSPSPIASPAPGAPGSGYGYGYGAPNPGYGHGYGAPAPGPPPGNGMAVAALVLGIVGLLGGIVPILGWFASPFALAAIGFAIAGLARAKSIHKGRGLAIGGLVTGLLGLAAITAWTAWLVVGTQETAELWSGEGLFGCEATRDDLEEAVEDFRAVEGREPASESDLIDAGHFGYTSSDFDVEIIDGRAEVVPQAGGDC